MDETDSTAAKSRNNLLLPEVVEGRTENVAVAGRLQ